MCAPEAHKRVDWRDDAVAITVEELNVLYDAHVPAWQHLANLAIMTAFLTFLRTCWMTV